MCPMSCSPGITSGSSNGGASAAANERAPTSTTGGEAPGSGETEPADRSLPLLIALAGGAAPRGLAEFARPRSPPPMSSVIETIERAQLRRVPKFAPGDRVKVHFQVVEGTRSRVQVFE